MKIALFAAAGAIVLSAAAFAPAAFAGTVAGAELATAQYVPTKCKKPEPLTLSVRTIKSAKAFTLAAESHNQHSADINDYIKCRQDELNADLQALQASSVVALKAENEAYVAESTKTADELKAKQEEIMKRQSGN
jgi:hypothetical protein